MAKALTPNPPRGEAVCLSPFLECGDKSPLWHWGTRHPVPALNLPQRQRRGLIPAWGHRPRNNAHINGQGPTARSMFPPRTTTGRAANPRPAAPVLECGDKSPLWNSMTGHRVTKRGNARALQNNAVPQSFNPPHPPQTRDPRRQTFPSPFSEFFRLPKTQSPKPKACFSSFRFSPPMPSARRAAHLKPGQLTGNGLGSQTKNKTKRPLPAGFITQRCGFGGNALKTVDFQSDGRSLYGHRQENIALPLTDPFSGFTPMPGYNPPDAGTPCCCCTQPTVITAKRTDPSPDGNKLVGLWTLHEKVTLSIEGTCYKDLVINWFTCWHGGLFGIGESAGYVGSGLSVDVPVET